MENLILNLTRFAIFGSWVWAAIIVGVVLIALFVSEVQKEGGIAFAAMLALVAINYFKGNLPLFSLITLANAIGYFGIGLLFTIVRIFFYGRSMAKSGNGFNKTFLEDNVFRWWFIWPVSLLTWLFLDLIGEISDFIFDKFEHVFESIMKFGYNSIKK